MVRISLSSRSHTHRIPHTLIPRLYVDQSPPHSVLSIIHHIPQLSTSHRILSSPSHSRKTTDSRQQLKCVSYTSILARTPPTTPIYFDPTLERDNARIRTLSRTDILRYATLPTLLMLPSPPASHPLDTCPPLPPSRVSGPRLPSSLVMVILGHERTGFFSISSITHIPIPR